MEVHVHTAKLLRSCLRREGFEVDGEQCTAFIEHIGGFLQFAAEAFNAAIDEARRDPQEEHSIQELVSWTISDLEQFLGLALQYFQRRLVDHITIDFSRSRPIRCVEAMTGTGWLPDICHEAAGQWRSVDDVPIRSLRFRRKKERNRDRWNPHRVDLQRIVRDYFA